MFLLSQIVGAGWGVNTLDANRRQTSDEEGAQPPPLLARSPYRPVSLRRRQELETEPQPRVERSPTRLIFDASPITIAAALAKAKAAVEKTTLAWGESAEPQAGAGEE
jgi:hypothetical protein